jgi:cyanophycin synthetase
MIESELVDKDVFDLPIPALESASLRRLSSWFETLEIGEVNSSARQSWTQALQQGDKTAFVNFFSHALLMLLQASRIPAFELPTPVERVFEDALVGETLEISFEKLDNFPPQLYRCALLGAKSLTDWAATNEPSPENSKLMFKILSEREIPSIQRFTWAGKSTVPVLRAAHDLGVPFVHLGLGVYQLGWGSKAKRIDRSITEFDSVIGMRLASNKYSTANLLRLAGLPAPSHEVVVKDHEAVAAAKNLGYPVVVKPLDLDRGEGVEVDITADEALVGAFRIAQKMSPSRQVIVERQVPGVCHRIFVANGKILYGVKRNPMSVFGDGVSSVQELVQKEVSIQESRPPWKRTEITPLDNSAAQTISAQGFTAESVPERGQAVRLRRIESTQWGGVDEEVTSVIHPANQEISISATKLFNLYVAGVDIITEDISKPWTESGAIINEVNIGPLFGGGPISKSHIPTFLKGFVSGDGKIPLIEEASREAAIEKQSSLLASGNRAYFTSSSETLGPNGESLFGSVEGIAKRLKALVCRVDVDSIVLFRG